MTPYVNLLENFVLVQSLALDMCNVYMELDMVFALGVEVFEFDQMC